MAWRTSHELAVTPNDRRSSGVFLRTANRRLLLTGVILAGVAALMAPWIAAFLRVPPAYVLLSAGGLPFQMATPLLLGLLQGEQRFRSWSSLVAGLAAAKFVGAGALVVPFGTRGVLLGISTASALTYVTARFLVRDRMRQIAGKPQLTHTPKLLPLMLAASLAIALLMSSDVILVKHLFRPRLAGEYAAVAALSRSIFWGMGGITGVLFPKVAARHARDHGTSELIAASLGLAALGSLASMVVFSAGGTLLLATFAGRGYTAGSAYLGWYALGMALLGAAAVLISAQQSLARMSLLWVLVPGTLLKPCLILLFHRNLLMVVQASDLAIAALLVALTLLYVAEERARRRRAVASAAFAAGPTDSGLRAPDAVGIGV
jgi:O-antigen/teichoic acid export membrane protein